MKPVENMDMSKIMPDFFSSETSNLELVKHAKKSIAEIIQFSTNNCFNKSSSQG